MKMASNIVESERLFYKDHHNWIFNGDARNMWELPNECVQAVCTSPPFWGLRKYSGEQDLIWGDNHCEHRWGSLIPHPMHKSGGHTYLSDISKGTQDTQDEVRHKGNLGCWCQLCGAWKGAYGLEPTPEMYIEHTIQILREIRRVLRKDGVVFWDIGDSYYGGGQGGDTWGGAKEIIGTEQYGHVAKGKHPILKTKDLCLIPFRVAIAAQEDGWWVRSVIIWSKPNPMPESVTDRPTESHEYILMLTKSARYYWDADAVREEYTEPLNRWGGPEFRDSSHKYIELGGHDGQQKYGATSMFRKGRPVRPIEAGRNIRSVWEFPTQPYPEAHFAVFPEKLPEICIKAATPEVGCCGRCGAPWVRIIDKTPFGRTMGDPKLYKSSPVPNDARELGRGATGSITISTLGWQPTCKCNADKVPSLVLDPFCGTFTTGFVAKKLGRYAVGYDTSGEYCDLAIERNRQQVLI